MWAWSVGKTARMARLAVVVGVLAVGLGFVGVSGASGQTVADVEVRDRLVADQESLLNVYRCMFDVDVEVVPGGCADGAPVLPAKGPAPFAGVPTAGDLAVRDQLVADQEALLNVYRCQFNIDTELVPDGCPETAPTTQTEPEEVDEPETTPEAETTVECAAFTIVASYEMRCALPEVSEQCQPVDGWVRQYWIPLPNESGLAPCGKLPCGSPLVAASEFYHVVPPPGGQFCVHHVLATTCQEEALYFLDGYLACWEGDLGQIPDYHGPVYPCPAGYVLFWEYASDLIFHFVNTSSRTGGGVKGDCATLRDAFELGWRIVD